ncbi:MAG: hypothetical protein LBC63_03855 [Holophagales bacterium]|nr:hypothetical protein [Holophagales bacterium]
MISVIMASNGRADFDRENAKILERQAKKFAALDDAGHADAAKKLMDNAVPSNENMVAAMKHIDVLPDGAQKNELKALYKKKEAAIEKAAIEQQKAAAILQAAMELEARKNYAKRLETMYLDKGLDVRVTLQGKNLDILKLRFALAGRVIAHQMSNDTAFHKLNREHKIQKMILTDGYDYETYWDYTKD